MSPSAQICSLISSIFLSSHHISSHKVSYNHTNPRKKCTESPPADPKTIGAGVGCQHKFTSKLVRGVGFEHHYLRVPPSLTEPDAIPPKKIFFPNLRPTVISEKLQAPMQVHQSPNQLETAHQKNAPSNNPQMPKKTPRPT